MSRRPLALAALSGLLLAAGFPPIDLPLIPWFALAPLFLALENTNGKSAFLLGGASGIVFFASTIHWIANALTMYGNMAVMTAWCVTLLLCCLLSLFFALFGAGSAVLKQEHPALFFLSVPLLWTSMELARTCLFTGFPWLLLGYSQHRLLPVVQIADITGVYGISFLIVLVNAAITELARDRSRVIPAAVAGITLLLVLGYGMFRLNGGEEQDRFTVAIVQGNIDQHRKWDPEYQSAVIAAYEGLTMQAAKGAPDLVLWPETATPFYFNGDGRNAVRTGGLRNFVHALRTPLLTGSPTYDPQENGKMQLRNSAVLIGQDGGIAATYHKMHLVPFGEYVPMKTVLPSLRRLVQSEEDFQPGAGRTVMQVHGKNGGTVPIGVVICYEIIFPDQVRRFVDQGAAVIATITNDAWFGRTAAAAQHFSMAVLRAVENRVPVARAANTGISGFIDTKGRILAESPIFTEAVLTRSLTPGTTRTFYTKHGDVFAYACCIAASALLLPFPRKNLKT